MLVRNVALSSLIRLADKLLRHRCPLGAPFRSSRFEGGNDLEEGVADLVVRRDVAGSRRRRTVHRHRRHRSRWRHPRNSPRRPFFMSPSSGRVEVAFAPSNATGSCFPTAVFAVPRRSPEFRLRREKPGEKPSSLRRLCSGSPQCSRTGLGRCSKLSSQVELT
jgi:hypothetical protein